MKRTRTFGAFAAACVAVLVAGCSPGGGEPTAPAGYPLSGDFAGSGPGTLVAAETLNILSPGLRAATSLAARITYISTSGINDSHSLVSATVFVPKGNPPEGGWKIVALGHPATGIEPRCAPSMSPTLLGSAPMVTALIDAGYLVTMSDYQGLGLRDSDPAQAKQAIGPYNDYHPFLDSTTIGYNVIDSVRAARKLVPGASRDFAVWGTGQGGQAAWAANELATDYHGDLKLVGAVAVAPTAALEWFADAAAAGALSRDQMLLLLQYLAALKNANDDFNLDAYRHGAVKDGWDVLAACWGPKAADRSRVADQVPPNELRPDSPAATEALRNYLQKTSLPQAPTIAPMLVVAEAPDGVIPTAQTDAAVARACAMGDVIAFGAPMGSDMAPVLDWIGNRMNGVPAQNDCATASPADVPDSANEVGDR